MNSFRDQDGFFRRERTPRLRWFPMLVVWSAVFLIVWAVIRPGNGAPRLDPTAQPREVTPRGELSAEEVNTIDVFRRSSPAVVYVTSSTLRRNLFSLNAMEIPQGTGSGFIYDSNGHVVTNFHVIMSGIEDVYNRETGRSLRRVRSDFRCRITLSDRSEHDAEVVGFEADKDIAVLRIEMPGQRPAPLAIGTSHDLQVGQKVLAIGNPFGLDQTLTTGIVSALGREIRSVTGRTIRDVIQTDAAINPGNSGGPLLDGTGRLIGMNTQIASTSGSSAGIGFAVPVDTINQIVPDIIRFGIWKRPVLGVELVDDRIVRFQLGLRGVLLDSVRPGSGAEKAGMRGTVVDNEGYIRQLGDIIIKVNDTDIDNSIQLKDALDTFKAGESVRVTYVRDGKPAETNVELQLVP